MKANKFFQNFAFFWKTVFGKTNPPTDSKKLVIYKVGSKIKEFFLGIFSMFIVLIIVCFIMFIVDKCKMEREIEEQSKQLELLKKQKSESAGKNINGSSEQLNKVPKRKIVHSFVVKARIYHFIVGAGGGAGFEKPTDKYIDIKIDRMDDGSVYFKSFPVRFSPTNGYDYECNDGNIIFKFNTDELL